MKKGTKKTARIKKVDKIPKKGLWISIAVVVMAFVLIVAYAKAANTRTNIIQYENTTGMMSGGTTNQGMIAECNEIMHSYGLNQSVINAMQSMMSGGMMQMMGHQH